jgi:hypothetical protein
MDSAKQSSPRSAVKVSELTPEHIESVAVALEKAREYDEKQNRAAKVPRPPETSPPAEKTTSNGKPGDVTEPRYPKLSEEQKTKVIEDVKRMMEVEKLFVKKTNSTIN